MCNDYRLEVDIASIAEDFDGLEINIDMPEGAPNVPAREDVRITDTAPIVKSTAPRVRYQVTVTSTMRHPPLRPRRPRRACGATAMSAKPSAS